jgi:SAM-dependent methyltransferase
MTDPDMTRDNDEHAARDVFQSIYDTDHWKQGSGEGSYRDATDRYREVVAAAISGRDVRTVVDAGCGDWQFSKLIEWGGVHYVGLDVVPDVVEENTREHGSSEIEFRCVDVRHAQLPEGDLLICKDVLQHWDIESITRFLAANLTRYRYLLITNDVASVHWPAGKLNAEISLGHWRTLDLERPPFGLRAQWRLEYDIRGEWTKRVLLFVRRRDRASVWMHPRSAFHRCRTLRNR